MADATLYKPGASGGNQPQPSIPEDPNTNQFGVPFSGPIRQLAGSIRRRGPFSSGIGSSISTSRNQLYKNPGRSIY
jgi:hypothetical protein